MKMKCPVCGLEIKEKTKICQRCGKQFKSVYEYVPDNYKKRNVKLPAQYSFVGDDAEYAKECPKKSNIAISINLGEHGTKAKQEPRKRDKVPHCPQCGSTAIQYGTKTSLPGAIIGYEAAGKVGALIGSTMSKKHMHFV